MSECKGFLSIFDALRGWVSCVQFENREKHPQRNVTFSKIAG